MCVGNAGRGWGRGRGWDEKPHLFWSSTVDIGTGRALVTLRGSTLVTTATPSSTVISYRTVQHAWSYSRPFFIVRSKRARGQREVQAGQGGGLQDRAAHVVHTAAPFSGRSVNGRYRLVKGGVQDRTARVVGRTYSCPFFLSFGQTCSWSKGGTGWLRGGTGPCSTRGGTYSRPFRSYVLVVKGRYRRGTGLCSTHDQTVAPFSRSVKRVGQREVQPVRSNGGTYRPPQRVEWFARDEKRKRRRANTRDEYTCLLGLFLSRICKLPRSPIPPVSRSRACPVTTGPPWMIFWTTIES